MGRVPVERIGTRSGPSVAERFVQGLVVEHGTYSVTPGSSWGASAVTDGRSQPILEVPTKLSAIAWSKALPTEPRGRENAQRRREEVVSPLVLSTVSGAGRRRVRLRSSPEPDRKRDNARNW